MQDDTDDDCEQGYPCPTAHRALCGIAAPVGATVRNVVLGEFLPQSVQVVSVGRAAQGGADVIVEPTDGLI